MANTLDAVLNWKAQQAAEQKAQADSIGTAFQLFNQARQQAIQNNIAQMQIKVGLAEKGIKLNPDGTFARDTSLQSPLDQLIEKGKAAEAARTLGDRGLFDSIVGNKATPNVQPLQAATQQAVGGQTQQSGDLTQYLNEVDPFTQKPTPRAEQAKVQLETMKKDSEPLSGDTASKFSGADQGIKNINEIIAQINGYKGDKKDLIRQANKVIEASNAKDTFLPGGKGIYRAAKLTGTSEEAKVLANKLSTVAENLLRARTGAAATTDEINREFSRSLMMTVGEGVKGWNQKLKNNFDYLKTTHDEIRPLRKDNAILNGEITDAESNPNISGHPLETIGKDIGGIAAGIGGAVSDPGGAFKGASDLAGGVTQNIPGSPVGEILKNLPGAQQRNNVARVAGQDLLSKYGGVDKIMNSFATKPVSTLLDLAPIVGATGKLAELGISTSKAAGILKQTAPIVQKQSIAAQSALTKLKGDEIINTAVSKAREGILGKGGYVSQEHGLFAKAIDKIKESDTPTKAPDELLRKFALANRDETTLKFSTPEMQKVYDTLSQKFSASGKLTEGDIVTAMKELKGKFGSGKVDANKRMNLNAASDLAQGLSGENSKILKNANTRYAAFKTNEKNIDELLGLYGKAKKTDSVVNSLLSKDLGIEQSKVAQFIGDKTGMNLLDTINYYRGVNQLKDAFWLTRQIDSFASGAKKIIDTKVKKINAK